MAKRADRVREQSRRKRAIPRLRWADCVRMDICKVGVVGEWRELAEDRGRWKSFVIKAEQKFGTIRPHHL